MEYRVTWSEEDKEYVGLCAEFPSLSWLADSQEEAMQGIRAVVEGGKMTLNDRDFDRFMSACAKPDKPNKALVDLMKADKEFMDGIKRGVRDCKVGRTQLWSEVKKELNIE